MKFAGLCRNVDCYGVFLGLQAGLGVSLAASASVGAAINACNQTDLEGWTFTFNVTVIPEAGVAVEGGCRRLEAQESWREESVLAGELLLDSERTQPSSLAFLDCIFLSYHRLR